MALNSLTDNYKIINSSPYLAGFIMILLNIGGRYIELQFSKSQENFIKRIFNKELLVFAVAWMGTRDIITAFIIALVFILIANFFFNDESSYCILPESMINYSDIDDNNNGLVTEEERKKAEETIKRADKEKHKKELKNNLLKFKNNVETYHFI